VIETDREFLLTKMAVVARHAFVDIRNLSRTGAAAQIHDLADVAELVADFLARRREEDMASIRHGLEEYAEKYGGIAGRLLQVFDLDEATFNDLYRADWREPADAR
jgi:hypothetical protein